MGCCFSCDENEGDNSEKTRLVGNERRHKQTFSPPVGNDHDNTPVSARRYRPIDSPAPNVFEKKPLHMRPTKVPDVDKRLEDHAQLFNEHLERRNNMLSLVRELQLLFPKENPNQNLHDTFYHINKLIHASDKVRVKRRYQYCMEIEYDGKNVHHAVIPAFLAFNKANRLAKDIVEKGPGLVASVLMVVDAEKELRRNVLVASLGQDGPESMKHCIDNIADLQKIPGLVEDIKAETIRTFNDLKSAVQILTSDESDNSINEIYA